MLRAVMPKKSEPLSPESEAREGVAQKPADEKDLISRLKSGEQAAFDQFYREFRRTVAASLFRVLGDATDLDDLVQEVFLIAFRGMARFRGDAKLSTWLYRICVNVALGRLRTRGRRPLPVLTENPVPLESSDSDETPERVLLRREDISRVYRALDTLSPKKRLVIVLREIEGKDVKEIAEIVSAPLVTVRTRLHYARKDFFRALVGTR